MKFVFGYSLFLILLLFSNTVCQAQTDTIYIEEEYDTIIVEKPVVIEKQVVVVQAIPQEKYQLTKGIGAKVYGGAVYRYPCACDDSVTNYITSNTGNESYVGVGLGYQRSIKKRWSVHWWNDVYRYQQKQTLLNESLNSYTNTTDLWYVQTSLMGGYDILHNQKKPWRLTFIGGLGSQYLLNRSDYFPNTSSQSSALAIKDVHRQFMLHATGQLLMTHVLTSKLYLQYGVNYQVDLIGPMKSNAPYYFYRNRMGVSAGLTLRLD
ncbi:MAG: hypothetical protein U0U66_12945 [Cytophagaceae bacterium]